jgi:type 1 glutamine amidotransferase
MAWYHKFEGGRAFYTTLGHADDKYIEPIFLQHILKTNSICYGKIIQFYL